MRSPRAACCLSPGAKERAGSDTSRNRGSLGHGRGHGAPESVPTGPKRAVGGPGGPGIPRCPALDGARGAGASGSAMNQLDESEITGIVRRAAELADALGLPPSSTRSDIAFQEILRELLR